jgi:hypothetical protein
MPEGMTAAKAAPASSTDAAASQSASTATVTPSTEANLLTPVAVLFSMPWSEISNQVGGAR